MSQEYIIINQQVMLYICSPLNQLSTLHPTMDSTTDPFYLAYPLPFSIPFPSSNRHFVFLSLGFCFVVLSAALFL